MSQQNRRAFLASVAGGAALAGGRTARGTEKPATRSDGGLQLTEFEPRSMLHLRETRVERARFPLIDVHAHLGYSTRSVRGVAFGEEVRHLAPAAELLRVMDRKNVRTLVNLTGGVGHGLAETLRLYDQAHPGRFLSFTEPTWPRIVEPGYAQWQADEIERATKAGARGLKVLKTLGLYLREQVTGGRLLKVDDRRFDPMWEACGGLGIPVAIHVSDPEAFFLPIDRFNERWEELHAHPDWSFHGSDFPSNRELLEARNRVFERHPRTRFIALHVGNDAENLPYVSECLDRFPNLHLEIGARIGELGRQPFSARRFFDRYQDRILFGTDAVPHGDDVPQQLFGEALYEIYYRFLETGDEYFDYAPARIPPQGRWRIYGLALPESVLEKVYRGNAARLLQIAA